MTDSQDEARFESEKAPEEGATTAPESEEPAKAKGSKANADKPIPKLLKRVGKAMIVLTIVGCLFMLFAVYMITATFKTLLNPRIPGGGGARLSEPHSSSS